MAHLCTAGELLGTCHHHSSIGKRLEIIYVWNNDVRRKENYFERRDWRDCIWAGRVWKLNFKRFSDSSSTLPRINAEPFFTMNQHFSPFTVLWLFSLPNSHSTRMKNIIWRWDDAKHSYRNYSWSFPQQCFRCCKKHVHAVTLSRLILDIIFFSVALELWLICIEIEKL